jgi:protein-S-isoprenylcysteine O-methyltransferase Ste14
MTIFVVPLVVWRITCEEQMLVTEFGEAYQVYRQQTRWRLIPLIY